MTFNLEVRGDYKMIMEHIRSYKHPVKTATFEDFNGQTMYRGVSALGFQTEEERFQFILAMSDKLHECKITDRFIRWGHTEF